MNDGPDHQGMTRFANVYLDDLIVFSPTWEEHLSHLREVLKKLGEVGLTVKLLKSQLAMLECTYLGHVVGSGVVKPVASKLHIVNQFPSLQLRSLNLTK